MCQYDLNVSVRLPSLNKKPAGSRRTRRHFFATGTAARKRASLFLAATMASSALTLVTVAAPVEAAPVSITVDKTAPDNILVGQSITYTLKATNPADDGDADFQYNLSFRDVLPAGVAYVAGSTPAGMGDPVQIAERGPDSSLTGRTILIWNNVADLPDGAVVTLTYKAQPDADVFPVGATVTNEATGYSSSDERRLAKFDSAGGAIADPVISQSSSSAQTLVSALELRKSEPSSEHELVRGVHQHPTVYTLEVINNGKAPTNGVKVVDYLPAGLEFLGCGGVDNTSGDVREYAGAPRLTGTPAVGGDCLTPTSVTTVNSDLPDGYPAGVYTRVEWTLPTNLTAAGTYTIKYAAGIPLKRNVMPSGAGFVSTANLDNNTGSSTRESESSEPELTNRAIATGRYQGPDTEGDTDFEVTAADKVTVTAEDIAVAKSITNGTTFAQGDEIEYSLLVRTSEYTDGSGIVLVDTLADGLCPSDAPASAYTEAALAEAGTGACEPSSEGSAAIAKVDFIDEVYVITFEPISVTAAQASTTIEYSATLRDRYNDSDEETSAGDSYTNKVDLTGTTTPVAGTGESGSRTVLDESSTSFGSGSPKLDKRILPNTAAVHTCNENDWSSWEDSQASAGDAEFTPGSRVCFQVRVQFPADSSTRNPVVTDYLPDNLIYEPGSFSLVQGVNTVSLTVDQGAITAGFADGTHAFAPGTGTAAGRYVEKGQVFAFKLSAIVQPNPASTVDVQGNLAKLRWVNRAGQVSSLRDQADFRVPPVPPVRIDKQVAKVPVPATFANSQNVVHGDVVRYRVAVTNGGTTPVGNIEVWDTLPVPYTCANVANISNSGVCTDPGAGTHPSFSGNDVKSAIRWVLPATVAAGSGSNVTYDVTIPTGTSVDTTYTNTAGVVTFTTPTNLGGTGESHFPRENISASVPSLLWDAPEAKDTASVKLPKVGLTKSNTTDITETNNSASQAVPGESVEYRIRATVPARTTVYNGVLSDPMPTGVELISATARYSATGANPAADPLPTGVTISSAGTLTLPATWTNATDDSQVFEVTVQARIAPGHTGTTRLTNTATFQSKTTLGGSVSVDPVEATSDVTPVQPSPSLTKALTTSPTQSTTPAIGESRQYELKASNATGRPNLYDTVVVDCVPAGLVVTALGSGATQAAAASGDACASVTGTGTTITWDAGTLAPGQSKTLRYTVQVGLGAAGGQAYKNVANLTGSTLEDGVNDSTNERVLTATDNKTLTVPPAGITKAIADNTLVVGERAEYTAKVTLPANVNFYDAIVTDALPAGLTASTLTTTSIDCTFADETDCTVAGTALTASGQNIGWFLGDLAESTQTRTVTIKFSVEVADNCTVVATPSCNTISKTRSNTVKVGWNQTNKTNPTSVTATSDTSKTSTAVVFTVLEPKIAIAKTVTDATPAPGDTFTYGVTVSNPGGTNVSDAHNIVVKDVVPAGVVVTASSISDDGTYDSATRTITWNVDQLTTSGASSSRTFTYDAVLAATDTLAGTALVNTVTVTNYEGLPEGGRVYTGPNTTATVTPDFPHTSVVKTVVGSDVSYVGAPQNFRITVTSDGASPAYKVDVTDVLPKNWTLDAASATVKVGDAAAVAVPPTTDDAGNPQTVAWTDLAPTGLAVGKTIVINYTATPSADALDDAGAGSTVEHTNTVTINAEDKTGATSSSTGSFHGDPDDASAYIHEADLQIVKSGNGTPVAGMTYTWDIVVKNLGGDPAVGPIVVTDSIPDDVSGFTLTGTGWTCSSTETDWSCTRPGPLANGASLPVIEASGVIDADLVSGSEVVNTASVAAKTYDPDSDNNTDTETVEVEVEADLAIDKRLGGTVITAGENATWTLDVTNLGPSTSRAPITVTDTLPAGSTFVSATGTGWDCEADGREITCERDTKLLAGVAAPQITVVAKIPAAQTAAVVNTAEVAGTTPEPDTETAEENNTDEVSTTPTRTTDLTIDKSLAGDDPAVAGSNATYDMQVQNVGPSTATSVKTVDTLPSYMTFVSASGTGWTCDADGQVVTCTLAGSMAVDGDSSYSLTVDIASGHTGDIANTVKVTAAEDPTGDDDTDTNTPDLESDLKVVKSHTGTVVAGESITYDVEVTNSGPSDTDGPIVVEDTVPTGMTYVSGGNADWDCELDEGVVTCTYEGGMADGDSDSFSLTFDIAPTAGPATVSNVVTVDGPNTDPEPENNNDTDPTEIVDQANVKISKVAQADTVHAGANVTWLVTVENDGPSTADSISVSDILPAGLTWVSASGDGWDCDEVITCTRSSLAPDASASFEIVTSVGSGVAADTVITNSATVSTTTPGDDEDDNSDDDSIEITTSADLNLAKTHTGTPVAGTPFTFSLTVNNDGPSNALAPITIADTLPVGMTYLSANDAWACVPGPVSDAGQEVECTLVDTEPLLPGEDAPVLTMSVDIAADQSGQELTNSATASSSTPDPTPTDNTDTDTVTPTDEVDLSIVKSHTGPVEIGQPLTFTIQVSNEGPSEARDVEVADLLPAGLTFQSAQGEGWTCAEDESTCSLDDPLAPGADAAPITVTVTVTPEAYPGVDNVATVTTSSDDQDETNDRSTDSVVVPPQVNLSIVKELTGKLRVGQQGVYTLTVNNDGPTLDPGQVTVTDELPAGLTFVSGEADGWTCAAAGQLVTCDREGDLAVDASETITLTVDVGAKAYPSVTNSAVVSTESPDTDPTDDKSTVESPVEGHAVLAIDKSLVRHKGDRAVWSIKVTNEGPTETTGRITVTDKLPRALKYVSAKGDGWKCSATGRVVTCDRDLPMAVGDTAEIEIATAIKVDDGSEIVNVASVKGGNLTAGSTPGTDSEVSDDAVVTAPQAGDGSPDVPHSLIPDTGGPAFWLLLMGLLGVFGGAAITTRNRGRQVRKHV